MRGREVQEVKGMMRKAKEGRNGSEVERRGEREGEARGKRGKERERETMR